MRKIPRSVRAAIVLLALSAPFLFPWQASMALAFAAGLVFPPLALFIGFLFDVLYHPGHAFIWGTFWGVIGAAACYAVRYIVRTRIM